jgi:RNA polymerase sigma-70 factor (ECF subfamily)
MSLAAAFCGAWQGKASDAELEALLVSACTRGHARWELDTDNASFCRYLAARAPVELSAAQAIGRLHVEDLYLACACLDGLPLALRRFDEQLLSRVDQYLARLRPDAQLIDETRQALRARLFVGSERATARIAQYSGLGSLDGWLRVAAVRTALDLISARDRGPHKSISVADELLVAGDPELDYLREHYRATFAAALRQSIRELSASERALLRYQFVDGLTPGHIGRMYGVHRTTTMRQLAAAKERLLEQTRAHVIATLGISPAECDSLVRLVRSNLPMTVSSLFRAP